MRSSKEGAVAIAPTASRLYQYYCNLAASYKSVLWLTFIIGAPLTQDILSRAHMVAHWIPNNGVVLSTINHTLGSIFSWLTILMNKGHKHSLH